RPDFSYGARVVANVNMSHLSGNTVGTDGRGHGTFVAGIAAGSAYGYTGAAPTADIGSLDVMDDQGMALTSDVIASCNWILQNKATYNIKVANFSLHSTYPSNFGHDPLDQAVEKLWFSGVTVVAAAGNYGNADGTPSGVKYAPGNDPFVITVGAVDLGTSSSINDDSVAYWSAYGHTYDGFMKPDISADGRYMVAAAPAGSTLAAERPDKVTAPGYMQLSGTSFSAPVVAGTAAQLIARHPTWGPDQVKGALMRSARPIPMAARFQGGVGQLNAVMANYLPNPPNPNRALERWVVSDPTGGTVPVFDAVSWYDAAKSDISWDTISWDDVSWDSVSWDSVSWDSVSWDCGNCGRELERCSRTRHSIEPEAVRARSGARVAGAATSGRALCGARVAVASLSCSRCRPCCSRRLPPRWATATETETATPSRPTCPGRCSRTRRRTPARSSTSSSS
ncbi:MAG: S8 family serine peptidase, partial [Gaiellaceae bacterium]